MGASVSVRSVLVDLCIGPRGGWRALAPLAALLAWGRSPSRRGSRRGPLREEESAHTLDVPRLRSARRRSGPRGVDGSEVGGAGARSGAARAPEARVREPQGPSAAGGWSAQSLRVGVCSGETR